MTSDNTYRTRNQHKYYYGIAIIIVIVAASVLVFYAYTLSNPVVRITQISYGVDFFNMPSVQSSSFYFGSSLPSSGIVVRPGQNFTTTMTFRSVPELPKYSVQTISVSLSNPSALANPFLKCSTNQTFPLLISSSNPAVVVKIVITAPNSSYHGQVFVGATIGQYSS